MVGPHDLGGPAILYPELPRLAALAFEMEFELSPFHFDVVVLESSQPVALVVLGVAVVSHPDERRLQKMHDGGEHLFARKPPERHVLGEGSTDRRQAICKFHHVLVFRALAYFAKGSVVAILFSAPCIAPRCLEMPVGLGAYPHIRPGGRDRELADAFERLLILDFGSLRGDIGKAGSGFLSADPGLFVAHIGQARGLGSILRIGDAEADRRRIQDHENVASGNSIARKAASSSTTRRMGRKG